MNLMDTTREYKPGIIQNIMDLNRKGFKGKESRKHEFELFSDFDAMSETDIVGDYSNWDAQPLESGTKNRRSTLSIELKSDKQYYFRYVTEDFQAG